MAKKKTAEQLRGQLMLQISAGRFFRPGIALNETPHRLTVYSNGWFADRERHDFAVGGVSPSTDIDPVNAMTFEVVDRLEAVTLDGDDEFHIATDGHRLVDDLAYVMTLFLNRTFSRDHAQVERLVSPGDTSRTARGAGRLFPHLFEPANVINAAELGAFNGFLTELLSLEREDFARVMRAVRGSVEATRHAVDDPTGAYTDLVAALESLANDDLTNPVTWDRYDGRKRKLYDAALVDLQEDQAEKMRAVVLEADRAGLTRRFVSSTLARIGGEFYRAEAVTAVRPPRALDIEGMLKIAYAVRSRKSHVLEDLGEEAWVFTDGAETAFDPRFDQILTLAGLWRIVRHVVLRYVRDAKKVDPEPWNYRDALPGIIKMHLAPQYWLSHPNGFTARGAELWLNGAAEAFIERYAGRSTNGFNLNEVAEKIEGLVPQTPEGDARTAMVALHVWWHVWWEEWMGADEIRPEARAFRAEYEPTLATPSATTFAISLLSNWKRPAWTTQEWAELARARRADRAAGRATKLPARVEAMLQLEAADQLELAGRHDEAVTCAAAAVEEAPGDEQLIAWEERLRAGDHDAAFHVHLFLFGPRT